jgi:hypothetical protein
MIWPTPYPALASLHLGEATSLALPVVPHEERPRPQFAAPETDPELPGYRTLEDETTSGYGEIASIERDVARRATKVVARNAGATDYPWGRQRYQETIVHEAQDDHPEATSVRGEYRTSVELPGRTLTWESRITFRSDLGSFFYSGLRRLLEDGVLVRERSWEDTIPRDHQ